MCTHFIFFLLEKMCFNGQALLTTFLYLPGDCDASRILIPQMWKEGHPLLGGNHTFLMLVVGEINRIRFSGKCELSKSLSSGFSRRLGSRLAEFYDLSPSLLPQSLPLSLSPPFPSLFFSYFFLTFIKIIC